jgi:hypothetical protein
MAARCCLTELGRPLTELLDIGGDRDGLELVELKPAFLAPIAELFDRAARA